MICNQLEKGTRLSRLYLLREATLAKHRNIICHSLRSPTTFLSSHSGSSELLIISMIGSMLLIAMNKYRVKNTRSHYIRLSSELITTSRSGSMPHLKILPLGTPVVSIIFLLLC